MSRFVSYNPEQVFLLPPSVEQVLGGDHLCFFVHAVIERLNLRSFLDAYSEEGGPLYHPSLMLKVWLYAYLLGLTSSRRLEQRVREDLAFRYLAGGAQPDFWALNAFRRRHKRGINDVFVQVLELAQSLGLARIGTVAIDSTRVKANASPERIEKIADERQGRARKRRQIRSWQQACEGDDPQEGAGASVGEACAQLAQLEVLRQLESLPKVRKRSQTDPDSRFLRERGGPLCAGLQRRDRGQRGSFHCGRAGDAERARRARTAAHGGRGGTQMPATAGPRAGRQRLLLEPERGPVNRTRHRCVCPRSKSGRRTEARSSRRHEPGTHDGQ